MQWETKSSTYWFCSWLVDEHNSVVPTRYLTQQGSHECFPRGTTTIKLSS